MNKGIPTLPTSQVPFSELNPNSIGLIVNNSHPSINATLEYLISRSQIFESLYMRQSTIAHCLGYGERTIRRSLSYLHSFGLIFKHTRTGKRTCEYFVNAFFFTAPGRLILIIIFSISFLYVTSEPYGRQYNITNVNENAPRDILASADDVPVPLFIKKGPEASQDSRGIGFHCTPPAIADEFYNQSPWHDKVFWAEKPSFISSTEFDAIFYAERICLSADDNHIPKRNEEMFNFTKEQCNQIAQYPEDSIKRAMQRVQEEAAKGNTPPNLFQWFLTICRTCKPGEGDAKEKKNPETGRAKASTNNNHYLRTKDNWIEGHDVVQTPNTRQSEVKKVESQMEWAINVEKTLHNRYLNDPSFNKAAAMYANPLGEMIPQSIVDDIHTDCQCRSNVDKELNIKIQPAIDPFVDKSSTIEPVTKPHAFNWNDMILQTKPVEPEYVPNSHELKDVYIGEEFGEFQEILD